MSKVATVATATMTLALLAALAANDTYAAATVSGNARITDHFEEHGVELPQSLRSGKSQYAMATAQAFSNNGYKTSQTYASGHVTAYIRNDSTMTTAYYVDSYMCILNRDCTHVRDTLFVDGNQGVANYKNDLLTSSFLSQSGNYEDECTIQVSGGDFTSMKSTNNIHIS